ncbi:MAG: hypothetical protein IKW57_04170 [Alphaproteobacteria bacterium]|nr:hypothetical protein [Alphaproteobacteria bacterium]
MKKLVTFLAIYEIIAIMVLSDYSTCKEIFERSFCQHDGFQYLVICGFVPGILGLLFWWWPEIKKAFSDGNEQKTQQNYTKIKNDQRYQTEIRELDLERELNVIMSEYDEEYPKLSQKIRAAAKLYCSTESFQDKEIDRELVLKAISSSLATIIKVEKDADVLPQAKKIKKEIESMLEEESKKQTNAYNYWE